jgi:hypothetical protein
MTDAGRGNCIHKRDRRAFAHRCGYRRIGLVDVAADLERGAATIRGALNDGVEMGAHPVGVGNRTIARVQT